MPNEFNPKSGTGVSKEDAKGWIDKYDALYRKDKETDTKAIFFGKDVVAKLLVGKSAGITIFLGVKYSDIVKKEVVNLILVPTTEDGTLLWDKTSTTALNDSDAGAYDVGTPCPPYCAK
ncbi:hypothetical protein WBG78_02465 [Chryseolinea sp. T2]|uniref:hypothetical protein n=1 Tax=Chryseolinea sp. T2 TaxID=3129255 RepID=UPI003077F18A